jgi:hypothetical protein
MSLHVLLQGWLYISFLLNLLLSNISVLTYIYDLLKVKKAKANGWGWGECYTKNRRLAKGESQYTVMASLAPESVWWRARLIFTAIS